MSYLVYHNSSFSTVSLGIYKFTSCSYLQIFSCHIFIFIFPGSGNGGCTGTCEIKSPNYPNSYPNNAHKTWPITAPAGSIIKLQFQAFYVSISSMMICNNNNQSRDRKLLYLPNFCFTDRVELWFLVHLWWARPINTLETAWWK